MHRASGDTKEILPVSFCESSIALGDVRRDGCGCPIELISEEEKSLYCSGSTKKNCRSKWTGFLVLPGTDSNCRQGG